MVEIMVSILVDDDGVARRSERCILRRNVASVVFAIASLAMVIVFWPGKQKFGREVEVPELVGVEAFNAACGATLYREVCMQTLLPNYRAHSADAQGLTGIMISKAADGVATTLAAVLINRGVNPIGLSGERVCHSTLASSVDQLDIALNSPKATPLDEIQIRLRAATAFHTTCVDALAATGALEAHTVDTSQHAEKLLSNALAFVAALSQRGSNLLSWSEPSVVDDTTNSRSFLTPGDAFPSWMRKELLMDDIDPPVDVLVAKDGSGKFKSIQGAIDAAPRTGSANAKRYVIGIKAGVYNEQVVVPKQATNFMFLGDGAGKSIISGNRSVTTGTTTFFSPTLIVEGAGFVGTRFTARNTAAGGEQAVAMRVSADMAAFSQCAFDGGQDTLHTHAFRQFYRECTICAGDRFILGDGGAVASFHSCSMVAKK